VPALRGEARECASLALSRETPNPFESVGIAIDTVGGNGMTVCWRFPIRLRDFGSVCFGSEANADVTSWERLLFSSKWT
jgi:hypothetical protein